MSRTAPSKVKAVGVVAAGLLAALAATAVGAGLGKLAGGHDDDPAVAAAAPPVPAPDPIPTPSPSSPSPTSTAPGTPPSPTASPTPSRTSSAAAASQRPVSVAGFDPRHPVVANGRYGPLRIGMSYVAAMRTGWIDRSTWRPGTPQYSQSCPDLYEDVHGRVTVQLSRSAGVMGFGLHAGARTGQGLGIGSRWSTVTRVLTPHGRIIIPADSPYLRGQDPDGKGELMMTTDTVRIPIRDTDRLTEIWLAGPGWCEP